MTKIYIFYDYFANSLSSPILQMTMVCDVTHKGDLPSNAITQ